MDEQHDMSERQEVNPATLRELGFALCRVSAGQKKPTDPAWPTRSIEVDDFRPTDLIGIIAGPLSHGNRPGHALVIIDIDSPAALEQADAILPPTAMVEGKPDKPRDHRYFLVPLDSVPAWARSEADQAAPAAERAAGHPGPFKKQFRHKETKKVLIDFLGTGGQAVGPSPGNRRRWVGGKPGAPAVVPFLRLWDAVGRLALACGARLPAVNGTARPAGADPARVPVGDRIKRAIAYLQKVDPAVSGKGGHDATYWPARVACWGFDLGEQLGFEVLRDHFNDRCTPKWSDGELKHKCKNADTLPFNKARGWLLVESGNGEVPAGGGGGKTPPPEVGGRKKDPGPATITNAVRLKKKGPLVPLPMADVLGRVRKATGDWPRRVSSALFVHDSGGVAWLEGAAALFGFLGSKAGILRWHKVTGGHTKEEVYHELRRVATAYAGVEVLPHEPPIPALYYAHAPVTPGNGRTLEALLDHFRLASPLDRDLTKAGMVTLFWGGGGGCRPVFVYTGDGGRGIGKTKLAAMTADLGGGAVELAADEDIEVIKQRLLSPEGITRRAALLDNVKSRGFSWANFEALVTAPTISGKRLYTGEASRLNVLTYFVTLNGVALGTDLAQRSVIIKLDRPERSGTWEEETYRFIDQNRAALVGDIVAFLKGPRGHLEKHSRWAAWERDVLSRLPDPAAAQHLIAERQGQADVEEEEGGLVEDFFAKQLRALDYDPDRDAVHIPSEVPTHWYNGATLEKHKTITVGRILSQMHGEGRLHRLRPNPSRHRGRGFLWVGSSWSMADDTKADLEARVEAQADEKRARGRWRGP
jgi:hypothetical protein